MARARLQGPRRTATLITISVLMLPVAACGSNDERQVPDARHVDRTDTSSPFSVGAVPAGYEIETAGMGTAVGDWGSDSFGTVEPYTVLSPDGRADNPGVVLVGSRATRATKVGSRRRRWAISPTIGRS